MELEGGPLTPVAPTREYASKPLPQANMHDVPSSFSILLRRHLIIGKSCYAAYSRSSYRLSLSLQVHLARGYQLMQARHKVFAPQARDLLQHIRHPMLRTRIQCGLEYKQHEDVVDFFETTIRYYNRFPTDQWLSKHGIQQECD